MMVRRKVEELEKQEEGVDEEGKWTVPFWKVR